MGTIRAVLVQMDVRLGDPEANRIRAGAAMNSISEGTRLALLPELWSCSYDNLRLREHAVRSSDCLRSVSDWCAGRGAFALAGSLPWLDGEGLRNRAWLVSDAGEPLAFYDKTHLFPPMGEPEHFVPGKAPLLADMPGFRIGVAICYDLRFPEYIRCLALAGANLLLLCAEWPASRIEAWRILVRARAVENQMYVLACNRCGESGGERFGGRSMAVGPDGSVLAEAGEGEELLTVELDPSRVRAVREGLRVFEGRRRELYAPLTAR